MERVDCVVVGAGVVGLAAARALALQGREVIVIEAESGFGTGISARNSEVIHAGLYYPHGSLKARLCVDGNARLYAYCTERGVAHRRCGKLVVATQAGQIETLRALQASGTRNGVAGLRLLTRAEARAMEPALECVAALWSPDTGIIDSHGFMQALIADAEQAGALCVFNTQVSGLARCDDGLRIETTGAEQYTMQARTVVNAAGLGAIGLARRTQDMPAAHIPAAHFAKGNYFALAGRAPFSHLIYPVPEPGGLGVHLTLDLGGQAKFGPDVQWLDATDEDAFDYRVDAARADGFAAQVRRYWPGLPEGALQPAYAGVRPKLHGPEAAAADFVVAGPRNHGVPGLVHLFGIESPGLTASLALADEVLNALA